MSDAVAVDVRVSGVPSACLVEWEWENTEGLTIIADGDSPPPRLIVRVAAVERLTKANPL